MDRAHDQNPDQMMVSSNTNPLSVPENSDEATNQFVTFSVHGDEYGVDILAIQEIKAWSETTPLPNSPEFMRGVLNLRGLIVPIYDLKCRFGRGLTEVSSMHVIIIVKVDGRLAGMLVDVVSDIIHLTSQGIQPLPELDRDAEMAFLSGIANMDGRMVSILDIDSLFAKTPEAMMKNRIQATNKMITDGNSDGENA